MHHKCQKRNLSSLAMLQLTLIDKGLLCLWKDERIYIGPKDRYTMIKPGIVASTKTRYDDHLSSFRKLYGSKDVHWDAFISSKPVL